MNRKKLKLMLYLPTAVLGLGCMLLQKGILAGGYDEKGLLITGNPAFWGLWILTLGFLGAVVYLLPRLGDAGTYRMNFPACALSGGLMMAAGVVLAGSAVTGLLAGGKLLLVLGGVIAGCAMAVCGLFRLCGQRPVCWFDLAVCVYLILCLMERYRVWNADPRLQMYAFPLLARIAVMLFTLHRARMAEGMMDRRKLVFWGFAGIFLSLVALSDSGEGMFHLACGLWCAGGMCELKKFRKRKKMQETPVEPLEIVTESAPEEDPAPAEE